ncbi:U-box domain-containing protein 43 [Dorcoceras hygrometricum]|uniref:U-box domain-containing protein 43 n=1 Tax=Dorcoceras hygrometricum TaxID=472368 RepID=A0A2Z7DJA0_9LAMI|nr:U-box domain-containing protein 43 [Dorcoceras hygrometricum]
MLRLLPAGGIRVSMPAGCSAEADNKSKRVLVMQGMKRRRLREVCWRDRVSMPAGCSAVANVNASQCSCNARRKRRRLDIATGCPAARDWYATVACCWLRLVPAERSVMRCFVLATGYPPAGSEDCVSYATSFEANFSLGQPWSVMALQIIDLLSVAHSTAVKHLLMQKQALELQWTRPCCSMLFECTFDRGFYIPRNHKIIISTCWISLLRRIGDVWVVEDGYDRWVYEDETPVSQPLVQLPQRSSLESLAPICLLFLPVQCLSASTLLVNTLGWSRVYKNFVILDSAPIDFVPSSPHQSSTSTSSMHFTDEILQGTTTAVGSTPTAAQFSLPPAVSDSFNDLRTSMSRIISIQSKESRRLDYSHSEVLDKIKQLETTILDAFYQQNQTFHRLITGIRQEAHNDTNALSLGLKAVRTQTSILSTDQADARKEAKEQKAIIEDMDEKLATLRSEQLDFRAQEQENYSNLSSQLGELVAYINRGNDKKGEESSSRRPQPPPDDPNRPIGGNAKRGGGGGGSGGNGRRDDRKGSSTKKGSGSSGAGGSYKNNAEWWLYGKNQF